MFFEIEGHTDSTGAATTNEMIGLERAEAVKRYLYEQHHVPLHKISVISYGETKPVDSNGTRAGRARNRRVEVKVLSPEAATAEADDRAHGFELVAIVSGTTVPRRAPRPGILSGSKPNCQARGRGGESRSGPLSVSGARASARSGSSSSSPSSSSLSSRPSRSCCRPCHSASSNISISSG